LGIALVAIMSLGGSALAQTTTSGAIQGTVRDAGSGQGLAGVTVVATSRATQTPYSEITNDSGRYEITNLQPGIYDISFYYADIQARQENVNVSLGKVTPVIINLDTGRAGGEVIEIKGKAPTIDVGSTKQGVSLDQDYTRNIPVPGRTFASALGAASGSQADLYGTSFSGSSSLENTYIVDGVNTTGLNFGDVGTALINEFIQETEIITGGYNAEFGRSTGGVVNVVTKSGTNEFKGTVFAYGTTSALIADAKVPADEDTSSIVADADLAWDTDFGFDLGGPILKDKVWFYVGFAPRLLRTDVARITQRRTDCRVVQDDGTLSDCVKGNPAYRDFMADRDPETGFLLYEELDRTSIADTRTSYQFVSKVNFALSPEQQGQISVTGTPITGTLVGVLGEESATHRDFQQLTTDVGAKWNSKLNDNKTELEAVLGWHRVKTESNSVIDAVDDVPSQVIRFGNLGVLGLGRESERTVRGCTDSGDASIDDYPGVPNCPDESAFGYAIGGIGTILDDKEERVSAKLTASQRVEAAGFHKLKGGMDVELNLSEVPRHLSGDVFYDVVLNNRLIQSQVEARRFAQIDADGRDSCGVERDEAGNPTGEGIRCTYNDGASPVTGETINWSAFAQDEWSILPNLTLNAGLRYEEQRLRYSEELQALGTDPITGNPIGKNALVMNNMWAPRLGVIYDWTKEGRSKVYGHWGRFYESIPMRINERSFGGETFYIARYNLDQCGEEVPNIGGPSGENCPASDPRDTDLFGSGVIVAPGIKPQFMDEWVIGSQYEVLEDLKLGIAYTNRRLGRVLEDVSVDNAETYIIANPGEFDEDAEQRLEDELSELAMDDPLRARRQQELDDFRKIRGFDKASRSYDGLELSLDRRFSSDYFIQASYVYSRTRGNFPGLFSPDTGQLDPNITSQFDLIELLANRDGPLPQDRPHSIKLDGYYQHDFGRQAGTLLTGVRLRGISGAPVDALGKHYRYGRGESYLLPRGSFGRTAFEFSTDIRLQYARQLAKGYELAVFLDVFRLFNTQRSAAVDEEYTLDNANPIVGGEYEDLVYLKEGALADGRATAEPVTRKQNFQNTTARYAPRQARFGVRLTF
jgi:hypothetical protein